MDDGLIVLVFGLNLLFYIYHHLGLSTRSMASALSEAIILFYMSVILLICNVIVILPLFYWFFFLLLIEASCHLLVIDD